MSSYELPSPASAGVESSFDAMLRRAVAEDVEVLQELYQEYRHDLGTTDYVEIEVLPIYDQLRTIVEQLWPMIDLGDPLDLAFLLPYPDMEVHADIIETHFEQLAAITSNPEHLAGFHAAVMGRLDRDHTDLRVMEQLNAFVMLQRVVADVAACAELQSRLGYGSN